MSSKSLQRLSSFAQWSISDEAFSGITNFASKAAGAYFERSPDCEDDEVVCRSCGVRLCDWNENTNGSDCEVSASLASVHRIISPKCPAMNPSDEDMLTEDIMKDVQSCFASSLIESPYAKYLPSHIQACINTPERPARASSIQRTDRVRRQLFPESDQQQQLSQEGAHDPGVEMPQITSAPNPEPHPSILYQPLFTHPFKPKSGNYDHLFASHRLQTYPQPLSCAKYQTWAEEGFVFRKEQQDHADVMCVYCGTVLDLNGHQPGVVHRTVCPACPFVMGFDVGNISVQQEKNVRMKYFKKQAAKKQCDIEMGIKYLQYQNEEERQGCSDKVVCYSCGVELYDWSEEADVWQTHATVSPTCLHIINCKGQHFITQAANLQVLAEVKYPKGSDSGGISSNGDVIGEEPGYPALDMTAVKAALACRYPNEAILKASLKAADENHINLCKQQQVVLQKDTQLQQKDTQLQQTHSQLQQTHSQLQQTHSQLQQTHTQLQQKDTQLQQTHSQLQQTHTQLQQKDTQLQQTHSQLQQTHTQLQQKDTQLQHNEETVQTLQQQLSEKDQQLSEKDQQLSEKYQQLSEKDQQLSEKDLQLAESFGQLIVKEEQLTVQGQRLTVQGQQLRLQEEQIQSLMQQVQRLRADLPHRAQPAHPPQGDGANNARASNDEALRQSLVCKICMSDKPRMIFLPCGHLFSCAECTSRLPNRRCPVCRQDISQVLPAFVA